MNVINLKKEKIRTYQRSYLTYSFNTLEELALSMKPLTNFDAKDIINNIIDINEKKLLIKYLKILF